MTLWLALSSTIESFLHCRGNESLVYLGHQSVSMDCCDRVLLAVLRFTRIRGIFRPL